MKSVSRLGLTSLLALAAVVTASSASAQKASDFESKGESNLKWTTRTSVPGPTGTIFHPSGTVLGQPWAITVSVGGDLDAVASPATEPLLSVEMPTATLKATWADDKHITIAPVTGTLNDAIFKAHHTLAPHIDASIALAGLSFSFDYNATDLVSKVPGSAWKYNGQANVHFNPWGYPLTTLNVPTDPVIDDLMLVSASFQDLGMSTNTAIGNLALNGLTEDESFVYNTTSVAIGTNPPMTTAGSSFQIPTVDTDFVELPVLVNGTITYAGVVKIGPTIAINQIGGSSLSTAVIATACAAIHGSVPQVNSIPSPGDPGCLINLSDLATVAALPFDSETSPGAPITVAFPNTTFHIPLPNVKVADKNVDMGEVSIGTNGKKPATINNTGEKGAAMSFKSSDSHFTVTASAAASAKGSYALNITFTPTDEGPASADITVTSNDPNEPVQTIHVKGTGKKELITPGGGDDDGGTGDGNGNGDQPATGSDGGCGCRTVDGQSSNAPLGLAGFAALGLVLASRRRKK